MSQEEIEVRGHEGSLLKREVKAAVALVALFAGVLVFLWVGSLDEASPQPSPASRGAKPTASRVGAERLAPEPISLPAPSEAPSPSAPTASPAATKRSAQPSASAPSPTRPSPPARLEGIVIAPNGSPVATKVYAFEFGPRVNPTYSDFGRQTPVEVQALARRLSQDRGNLLATTSSDSTGGFSFKRKDLKRFEVMLVAASKEGVGALRLKPGAQDPILALEARRGLRVQVMPSGDLSAASLQIVLGRAGALEFPPLDPRGATRLDLPPRLPAKSRLRLERPGWLPLTRGLSAAELSGGRVTWTLPTKLVDIRGEVLNPEGGPWTEGEVLLVFRDPDERWRHLSARTDSKGVFRGRGFPPGQSVRVSVAGAPEQAYHLEQITAGGPPLSIRLQPASALRIRVERFEGDVDAIEAEWKLERREGNTWEELDLFLYGRLPRGTRTLGNPPPKQPGLRPDRLQRRFGLRVGQNEILGLAPGRYRVSLAGFDGNFAEAVEVALPPRGAASCELGISSGL